MSLCAASVAQEVFHTEPEPGALTVRAENLGESLLISGVEDGAGMDASGSASEPQALLLRGEAGRRGRWRLAPHFHAKGTYDDNIFIQPNQPLADYILTLEPGLAFGFWDSEKERDRYLDRQRRTAVLERTEGTFLVVDYTAVLLGFARTSSQNALGHDARFDARWEREKLTLGARVQFESKWETNAGVGGRIRRNTLSADVTSAWQITGKTALGFSLHHRTNDPENFVRTAEWRVESFFDYSATSLTRFGFGAGVGRVKVEAGADQIFQRFLARAAYALSEKVEAEFRGGVEFRQSDGPWGDRTNPIFEFRTGWTPRAGTRVGLDAFRRVEASAVRPDQDYTLTGFELNVRQAVRGGVHAGLDGGYHVADYIDAGGADSRRDRYFFIRPGLFYNFAPWGHVGVTHEYRRNGSNRAESRFSNNQTNVEFGLIY